MDNEKKNIKNGIACNAIDNHREQTNALQRQLQNNVPFWPLSEYAPRFSKSRIGRFRQDIQLHQVIMA